MVFLSAQAVEKNPCKFLFPYVGPRTWTQVSFGCRTQQIGSGHRSNQPSTLFWTVASRELLLKNTKPKILPLLCPTVCLERVTDQHQKENVPAVEKHL